MAKKGRTVNPADAFRKEQRKREVKKNKKERQRTRYLSGLVKDPTKILEEVRTLDRPPMAALTCCAQVRDINKREKDEGLTASDREKRKQLLDLHKTLSRQQEVRRASRAFSACSPTHSHPGPCRAQAELGWALHADGTGPGKGTWAVVPPPRPRITPSSAAQVIKTVAGTSPVANALRN